MLPLWFPEPLRVDRIDRTCAVTIECLCDLAKEPCRASGAWTQTPVVLRLLEVGQEPWIRVEVEDYGAVELGVPSLGCSAADQARWALGCMAYSPLRDLVALASCSGQPWARASSELPAARRQLPPEAPAFIEELAQVYMQHRLALGTYDPNADLGRAAHRGCSGCARSRFVRNSNSMKTVTATDAKNRFGRVLDEPSADLVILAGRGKECVALMLACEARPCILSAYGTGVITRACCDAPPCYAWYGQLTDATTDAGLHIQSESVLQQMNKSLDTVFGKRVKGAKRHV